YSLPPGRYFVRAGGQAGTPEIYIQRVVAEQVYGSGYSTPNRIPQFHTTSYYPGTADLNSATPIDLQSGVDLQGVDLMVSPQQPFRISGRVVQPETGRPPERVALGLHPLGYSGPGSDLLSRNFGGSNPNYKPADGSFEITGINA